MKITRSHHASELSKARIDLCVSLSSQHYMFPDAEYILLRLMQKNDAFAGNIFLEAQFSAVEAMNLGNRLLEAFRVLADEQMSRAVRQSRADFDPFPGL